MTARRPLPERVSLVASASTRPRRLSALFTLQTARALLWRQQAPTILSVIFKKVKKNIINKTKDERMVKNSSI